MVADEMRARYLNDRVLTASPAQRVVMLYDRLGLDIARARAAHDKDEPFTAATHTSHAAQIVAELQSSLNTDVWAGAADLSALYSFVLIKLIDAGRPGGGAILPQLATIVADLRAAWGQAADELSDTSNASAVATNRLAGQVA